MMNFKSLRSCGVALLWPLLGFGVVLAVGVWGVTQLATGSSTAQKAGYGCVLASITLLAVGNVALLSALLVLRRRHRDLLAALLPRQVVQTLNSEGGVFARAQADTPANLLLNMMGELLEGKAPGLQDVVFIRTALMSNMDVYQPFNLRATIKGANLDADVAQSLMNQLGGDSVAGSSRSTTTHCGAPTAGCSRDGAAAKPAKVFTGSSGSGGAAVLNASELMPLPSAVSAVRLNRDPQQRYESLSNALALILTPQPSEWQEPGGLPEDLTGELAAGFDARELKPSDRRTSNTQAIGLLEKAASLIDRSRRRRRMSTDAPTSMAALVDLGRDTGSRGPSITVGPAVSAVRGSTAGIAQALRLDAGIQGLLTDARVTGRRMSTLVPRSGVTDEQLSVAVAAAGVSTVDDDSTTNTTADGAAMVDGESCSGNTPPPPGEAPVPRRLSAVWGMLSKRGTGNLASPRKASLDGNPFVQGGRASPAASPGSFTVLRASSTQSPMAQAATELLQHAQSRLGVGIGGVFRTASVRAMGDTRTSLIGVNNVATSAAVAAAAAAAATALKRSMPPPPTVIDAVERLLAGADGWQFDTWALQEATQGHALSSLGFYLIQRAGLIKTFRLKPVTLARLLRQVESGYLDNPYHNAVHAADVLQTLHVIIHATQLHVHYLDPLGLLATYYAAIVHDYSHPGVTSDFLVATSDELAVRYNDRSPLENHHCAASFGLLKRPELDALAPLTKSERATFRKQVIELVLATDMKQHFSTLSHFNTVHRLSAYSQQAPAVAPSPNKHAKRMLRRTVSRALSGNLGDSLPDGTSNSAFASGWSEPAPKPVDETERLLSLQVVLKCADIGHLGEALEVHKRWLGVLEEEFFRQGDKEKELGLPISPLFDRSKQGVSKSQVGFYDFVALPLVHALSSAFPGTHPLMRCFIRNYNHWRAVEGQPPVAVPPVKGGGDRRSWQANAPAATGGSGGAAAAGAVAGTVGSIPVRVSEEICDLRNMLLTIPDDAIGAAGNEAKV